MDDLHRQYGDFVRTGPNELTIFHPDILRIINDGPNNAFSKPACKIVHKHRRRVWDHAFTTEALENYDSHVKEFAHQLECIIAENAGKPITINQYFYWFSFDVMGQSAFSKSFNMLKTQKWHHVVQLLRAGLELVGPLTPVPWLVRIGFDIPIMPVVRNFQKMEAWCAERMDERIEINQIDTTASTLTYICYRLAQHPEQLQKLQAELDTLDAIDDSKNLQLLPHLNGIINEVLRLHPAVPTGGLREAPAEGFTLSGRFDVCFAPDETGIRCVNDMVDQFTAAPGQLALVFSKRAEGLI
ncbi:MAG: hypothetical protein Q9186_005189 [Xanthomendoza sp. 1 TL-2023]